MKKSTQELLELMKNSKSYHDFLKTNKEEVTSEHMKVSRALNIIIAEKNLKKADVIAKSGIETHYAYQIFSGTKTPSRDKVIMLCIGMNLSVEDTQQLLKITGYAQLYSKEKRDNVLLFGIIKNLSIIDINDLLYEMGLELLV